MRRAPILVAALAFGGCTEVLSLDDYTFGGDGGASAGGGQGGNGGAPATTTATATTSSTTGSTSSAGGEGGGGVLVPPQPMPDSDTEFCAIGMSAVPCPSEGNLGFGQDGNYPDHPPQSLMLDASVNVHDLVTGLDWWVLGTSFGNLDLDPYQDAAATCAMKPMGPLGAWRLPTAYEIATVVDMGKEDAFLPDVFINTTPAVRIWTSTTLMDGRRVLLSSQNSSTFNCTSGSGLKACASNDGQWPPTDYEAAYVCVSGTSPPRAFRSDDSLAAEPTYVDDRAYLEWDRGNEPNLTWTDALTHCNDLVYGGHDDWRLPSFKELATLIDGASDSLPADLLAASQAYWSSTPLNDGTGTAGAAYFLSTQTFELYANGSSFQKRVQCVRGPLTDPDELPPQ